MATSWFRSLRLDAPVPEVTLVSAPQLMWYFPDGYCLPRVRQAVNISVSRCENEPARKRRKKTSAFGLGLGILHSDCLHPCSSAVADLGFFSGSCHSSNSTNKILALQGYSSSADCAPNMARPDQRVPGTEILKMSHWPPSSTAALLSSGAHGWSLQEHQAHMARCQSQEIPREIKSTSLTTSLPNRPEMCN